MLYTSMLAVIKMKNAIGIFIVVVFLQSCSKTNINSDLLGHWKSIKSTNIVQLKFFKDSLIYITWEKTTKFSWKSDGTKIYYTQLTNVNPKLETDFIMDYRLNSQKDTLFLYSPDANSTNEFIRINE